jgi:hypothetical protein
MRYIGLDVPYGTSTYCVLEDNGQEVQCETVRGHWPQLLDRLRTVAGPWTICFEAGTGSPRATRKEAIQGREGNRGYHKARR